MLTGYYTCLEGFKEGGLNACCCAGLAEGELFWCDQLREAKPGGFQTRGFPNLFFGKGQEIVSRTLSGLFLVGNLNRPRKRKRTNRENPRTIPKQIGKIPEKSGKSQEGQKRTKKEGRVQIGKPPHLKHPRLAALDHCNNFESQKKRTIC